MTKLKKRYGRWTVLSDDGDGRALVRCRCWALHVVLISSLRQGRSRQCRRCAAANARRVRTKFLPHLPRRVVVKLTKCAHDAVRRCTDRNHRNWRNYGGRGIRVHPQWIENRRLFVAYLATLEGYDDPRRIIDRIKNNDGYKPGNLRFVTRRESESNKRK